MSKFKKIDREFLYTDSSVNEYGFRLLTSGYLIEEFKRNPIGYKMHLRDSGVVVKWEDFRIDGDKVYAKPVINLSNPIGQQTADEIENGFLNAASVGRIVVLDISDDPKMILPGQEGPTVTKWYHKELSIVDMPGNANALAELFDADGNAINLADFTQNKKISMKKVFLSIAALAALNLKDDAPESEVDKRINDLMAEAGKVKALNDLISTQKQRIEDLEKAANSVKVDNLIDNAVKDKKITEPQKEHFKKLALADYESVEKLLNGMKSYQSVESQLADKGDANKAELASLMAISGDDLYKQGKLERLKELSLDHFKVKYKEATGVEYQDGK